MNTKRDAAEPPQAWMIETFCGQIETATAEGDDAVPAIFYGSEEHGNSICPLNLIQAPTMQAVIALALGALEKRLGKADWICFTCESYHCEMKPEDGHPGNLQELFEQGDPRVVETAMLQFVRSDGTGYYASRKFEKKDGKVIWKEEPDIQIITADDANLQGGVHPLLLNGTKWSEG